VPKTLVYRLAEYVNSHSPLIPRSTIEKPPSAELSPGQLDSDTLPSYEVLDAILADYIEDNKSPDAIAEAHGFDLEVVRKIVRMVDKSEYKRQQAAPGLKISEKAFGFGRRYPIAAKSEI
jgi:NH3-dependent NAD+ synthetase